MACRPASCPALGRKTADRTLASTSHAINPAIATTKYRDKLRKLHLDLSIRARNELPERRMPTITYPTQSHWSTVIWR
jgi:hypothetical protein